MVASLLTLVFSFLVRFGFQIPEVYRSDWLIIGIVFLVLKIPSYMLTLRYTHPVKSLNSTDIFKVFLFSLISSLLILGVNLWHLQQYRVNLFPNSVWLIDFVAFTNFIILFQIIGWSVMNAFMKILKTKTYTSYNVLKSFILTLKMLLFYQRREENNILKQLKRLEHI
jgi:hypothetical protein